MSKRKRSLVYRSWVSLARQKLLSRVISAVGDGAQTLPGKIGTGLLAAGAAVGVCVKAWKALSSSIRGAIVAVRAFGRASTAALISSGVGIALVALGTAYEFFASKKDELEAEAAKAEAEAAKAKDKAAQAERERKARAAREREELEREAQKARADREKSLERAESIRNEFEKAQHAILRGKESVGVRNGEKAGLGGKKRDEKRAAGDTDEFVDSCGSLRNSGRKWDFSAEV